MTIHGRGVEGIGWLRRSLEVRESNVSRCPSTRTGTPLPSPTSSLLTVPSFLSTNRQTVS